MTYEDEQQVRKIIQEELATLFALDRFTFQKHIQIFDSRNIQLGTNYGTMLGTETTQKLGFFGNSPVTQGGLVPKASGGANVDYEARAAINSLIAELEDLGLISD